MTTQSEVDKRNHETSMLEVNDFMEGDDARWTGYIDLKTRRITTWMGDELARITYHKTRKAPRHWWQMDEIVYWDATDGHGRKWYGRGGDGMVTLMRRKKG